MNHSADRVAIVIVNYQTPDDVAALVRDLSSQQRVFLDCICVDISGDVDDSLCAQVLSDSGFSWRLIHSENVGYGSANNIGLKIAQESLGARWAVVSNPDIEIQDPLSIWNLREAVLEQQGMNVLVAGPSIYTSDGRMQNPYLLSDMSPERIRIQKIKHLWPFVSQLFECFQLIRYTLKSLVTLVPRTTVADTCPAASATRVFALHGSFLMMDLVSMVEAGIFPPFDERLFMYGEEMVLARRVLMAEGSIIYVPSIQIVHKEDGSNRSQPPTKTLISTLRQNQRSKRFILQEYYRN